MISSSIPFDGEARDTRLLGKNIATDLLDDRLGRRVGIQLLRLVLIVDIVSNANELATIVGAGKQDDSDTHDFGIRNPLSVGGIGLEDELVDANRDGADQQGVELLVILVRGGRTNISQFPFKICVRNRRQHVARPTAHNPDCHLAAYPSQAAPDTQR